MENVGERRVREKEVRITDTQYRRNQHYTIIRCEELRKSQT